MTVLHFEGGLFSADILLTASAPRTEELKVIFFVGGDVPLSFSFDIRIWIHALTFIGEGGILVGVAICNMCVPHSASKIKRKHRL